MVDIAKEINELLFKGFVDFNTLHTDDRKDGIHVSSASYGCSRKLYLEITEPKSTKEESEAYFRKDVNGLFKITIGTKLHEISLTGDHEHSFMVDSGIDGIKLTGTADEIFTDSEGGKWLIDKKFVGFSPNFVMKPEHKRQVGFYSWLYKKETGVDVKGVVLIYFLVKEVYAWKKKDEIAPVLDEKVVSYFVEKITPEEIDNYGKELMAMVANVKEGIENKKVPEKTISWYCGYCRFGGNCFAGLTQEEIRNSINKLS